MPKGEHLKGKGGVKFGSGQPTNKGGRPKGKAISTYLRELGDLNQLSYSLSVTDTNGKKKQKRVNIKAKEGETLNEALAGVLLSKALSGDLKALQILLDRTEGKPKAEIDINTNNESSINDLTVEEQMKVLSLIRELKNK